MGGGGAGVVDPKPGLDTKPVCPNFDGPAEAKAENAPPDDDEVVAGCSKAEPDAPWLKAGCPKAGCPKAEVFWPKPVVC